MLRGFWCFSRKVAIRPSLPDGGGFSVSAANMHQQVPSAVSALARSGCGCGALVEGNLDTSDRVMADPCHRSLHQPERLFKIHTPTAIVRIVSGTPAFMYSQNEILTSR